MSSYLSLRGTTLGEGCEGLRREVPGWVRDGGRDWCLTQKDDGKVEVGKAEM